MGNPTTPPNLFADLPSKPSPIPPSASSLTQEQKINKEWMPKVRIHRPRTVVPPPPGVAEQLRNRPPPPPPPPPPSRNPNWSPIVIVDFPPSRTRAPPPPPPPQFTPSYPDKFKNQRNRNPQKLQRLQQQQQQPPMMMYSNNNNNILMNSNMAPPMRSRPQLPPQQRLPGYGPPSPTMLQNHIRMPQKSAPIKFFPPTRVVISQEDELLPPGVSNSLYKGGFLPPTRAQLSQQQAERFPPSSTKAVDMYATVPTKSSMMVPERLQKQQQQQQQRSPPRMSLTQMTPGIPQKTPHMVSLTRGTVAMPLQQQTPHKVSMTDSNKGMPMVSRQQQQQQQQSPPRMSMTDKDPRLIHPTARVMSANSNDIKDKHSNNNNMRMKKYMIEVMMPDQVSANPFQSAVRESKLSIRMRLLWMSSPQLLRSTLTILVFATHPFLLLAVNFCIFSHGPRAYHHNHDPQHYHGHRNHFGHAPRGAQQQHGRHGQLLPLAPSRLPSQHPPVRGSAQRAPLGGGEGSDPDELRLRVTVGR